MSSPSTEPPTNPPSSPAQSPPMSEQPNNANAGANVTTGRPSIPTIRFGVTATVRATQHQLPTGRANLGANNAVPPPTNNNTGEAPQQTQNLFQMRDRLFLALFFRVSLIYARTIPRTLRRALEFMLLMQSLCALFILGYIHIAYTRTPTTCLFEYKDSWPKNGVLRVEITNQEDGYDLMKSYAKEERMRQRVTASQFVQYTDDFLSLMFTADSAFLDRVVSTAGGLLASVTGDTSQTTKNEERVIPTSSVETEPPPDSSGGGSSTTDSSSTTSALTPGSGSNSPEGGGGDAVAETSKHDEIDSSHNRSAELDDDTHAAAGEGEERSNSDLDSSISPSIPITASGEGVVGGGGSTLSGVLEGYENVDYTNPDSPYFNKTLEEVEILKMQEKHIEEEKLLNSSVTDFEMFANSVWNMEQAYIVEYALEYGFLRLSPETRQKLGIPVKLVILNPTKETCFGDQFSLFLLENCLGYDDILMSSIKNLAETEENKGYLRNVVTGEQFRFVPMWMARTSYIPALLIMLVFTVSISMLLRYSHHQIFVFIVDLLNNIEGAGSIHIPAAPLFTVILALVGMEAIMSEFFNDTSTAFYVILIVWIADQYDAVCSHTNITKTYWVRFFYLYHYLFYAYHYRFNGQYGGLALLVSWSFIQHSMVFFYHHYELPAILRQASQTQHYPTTTRLPSARGQGRAGSVPREGGPPSGAPDNTGLSSQDQGGSSSTSTTPTEENSGGGINVRHILDESNLTTTPPPSSSLSPPETGGGGEEEGEVSSLLLDDESNTPTIFNRGGHTATSSTPTTNNIINNISSLHNHHEERGGDDGSASSNGMSSGGGDGGGVNNNDCNPSRKSPFQDTSASTLTRKPTSTTTTTSSSKSIPTAEPAQITTQCTSGCSNLSESQSHTSQNLCGIIVGDHDDNEEEDNNAAASSSLSRYPSVAAATTTQNDDEGLRHRLPTSSSSTGTASTNHYERREDAEVGSSSPIVSPGTTTPRTTRVMTMTSMMEELD